MRTTLKRGVGRGAGLNGSNGNGHGALPPSPLSPVVHYQPPPRRRSGLGLVGRFLFGTLLTLVALGLAAAGGAYLWFYHSVQAVQAHGKDATIARKELKLPLPDQPTIALFLGYDKRAGDSADGSRSDTIMLVRADPKTKTISLLSLPRDLGVPIYCPPKSYPGQQGDAANPERTDKINSAFDECGAPGTLDTVEHLTGLEPSYMVTVDFHGFKELVDKLGGVWMDVDRRYYHVNDGSFDQNYANINIKPGYQLLTGEQALDFVRYRHTDDDYHRIARQQEFVRALKQQFSRNFDLTKIPSLVGTIINNVKVYTAGKLNVSTVISYAEFAATMPGGHFFQDKINDVTGVSETSAPASSITQAVYQFTHPDVQASKAANSAALGLKPKPKAVAPPPSKTTVTVLNGNGVGGSAANASYLLGQRGYLTVLPPGNAEPNAPTQSYFHTAIYFDPKLTGADLAAKALQKLIVPSDVAPIPKSAKLRALDPGSMLMVVVGQTFPAQLGSPPPATPAPTHVAATVHYDGTTGLQLLQPYEHRVPFRLEIPTVIANGSYPDTQGGDESSRLYWIDQKHKKKAIRLVFSTGTVGDYWGVEETNMPDPPILDDKSFSRRIKGRTFQLYYSGSSLQMVALRVHDESYWVVNSLLDTLSNETMIAIAKGLKPLAPSR